MATSLSPLRTSQGDMDIRVADFVDAVLEGPPPFRFTAYDGSATGPADAPVALHVRSARGAAYLATAPGSLGMARAYVTSDLQVSGIHPGDPYPLLRMLTEDLRWTIPDAWTVARVARSLGLSRLV